jgi:cellulose synthase/poly-beta-1,6-N-acetylglucosamine synthase-like glycosyltransferase
MTNFISIILAVRNESKNITTCLQSLEALQYPKTQLEILIGNDNSEDNTEQLIQDFIIGKPHFKIFTITDKVGNLQGKANILAQLADKAQGEWLFFTDADMKLPKNWIQNMIINSESSKKLNNQKEIGIITGFTTVAPNSLNLTSKNTLFAKLQALDWTFYLALIHICSFFGLAMTSMGNNMAVKRKVYQEIGGYLAIDFSLTEDYALFKTIVKNGYDFQQLASFEVLGITQASESLSKLLQQRLRWLSEFRNFPIWIQANIVSTACYLPIMCITAYTNICFFLILLIFRILLIYSILTYYLLRTKQNSLVFYILFYDIFNLLFYFVLIIRLVMHLFSKQKTEWKGRKF